MILFFIFCVLSLFCLVICWHWFHFNRSGRTISLLINIFATFTVGFCWGVYTTIQIRR